MNLGDDGCDMYSCSSSVTNNPRNTVHSFISIIWYGSDERLKRLWNRVEYSPGLHTVLKLFWGTSSNHLR